MGYLYRRKLNSGNRGRIWWAQWSHNGKVRQESTGQTKKREAKRFLELREGAKAKGTPMPRRVDRILYDEVAEDLYVHYETTGKRKLTEVEGRLRHLDAFFRNCLIVNITADIITRYVQQRQGYTTRRGEPTSNRTINIELALLKKMLRHAVDNGKLVVVPKITMLKEAGPRQGFFEEAEYQAVRNHLASDLQVVVTIGYTFGWRIRSEVLTLCRQQLDLTVGTVRLEPGTTKNKEGRTVYLTPELKTMLTEQRARVDALAKELGQVIPFVFPHLDGPHRGQRKVDFRKAWETATKKAGIPWMLKHDFRRSAVRNLERSGVPRSIATKVTGHKTESVYTRYAIANDTDLQRATEQLLHYSVLRTPSRLTKKHKYAE